MPVGIPVVCQGLHGGDVDTPPLRVGREKPQQSHLCAHSLSTSGWGAQEDIVVTIVEGVEDLSLHRVELCEDLAVQILILFVPESGDRQWLQIKQLCWRRVLLREQKMSETDRQHSL